LNGLGGKERLCTSPHGFAGRIESVRIGVAVLVGGRSERMFGVEKPLMRVRGLTLVERLLRALKRFAITVIAVANPLNASAYEDLGLFDCVLIDRLCIGPLSGVLEALRLLNEVLVVGGDTVVLDAAPIERLIDECMHRDVDVCCFGFRGFIEPLPAIYRATFVETAQRMLVRGVYSLQRAIRSSRALVMELSELPWRDVDTFSDLAELEKALL